MYLDNLRKQAEIKKNFLTDEISALEEERDFQIGSVDGKSSALKIIAKALVEAGSYLLTSLNVIDRRRKSKIHEKFSKRIDSAKKELVQVKTVIARLKN